MVKSKFRPNWVNIFKCYACFHLVFALATYQLLMGAFGTFMITTSLLCVLPASLFIEDMVDLFGSN